MRNRTHHEDVERGDAGMQMPSESLFAAGCACLLTVLALLPLARGGEVRWWLAPVAVVIGLAGWLAPSWLRPANRIWFLIASAIGRVVTLATLTALYLLVITPAGLISRLLRKDPLGLRADPSAASYWVERRRDATESMRRQF